MNNRQHTPTRRTYTSTVDGLEDWYMMIPPASGTTWIVMIHGHGSHGDQLYTRPDIKANLLKPFLNMGFGILTPNLRDNAWMSPSAAQDLHDLLTSIRAEFSVDRFILFSGSMGGSSNLIYSVIHPEDVYATVAMCPVADIVTYHAWCAQSDNPTIIEIKNAIESAYGGTPSDIPETYEPHRTTTNSDKLTMPIYVCHGTDDILIPVEQSRTLNEKMKGKAHFEYTEIENGDHEAPHTQDKRVWEWLSDPRL